MNICKKCGYTFEDCDISSWEESRGEYWGEPCTETMTGCPKCHGEYAEAAKCNMCGNYIHEDNIYGGVCQECIDDNNDFETCLAISRRDQKIEIKINRLIYTLLGDEDEIETVLLEYIRSRKNIDCADYINEDVSWFGEQLVKEVRKNENAKG